MHSPDVSLQTELFGVTLTSPVLDASGTFGLGSRQVRGLDFSCFGAVVTKTVILEPRAGNLETVRLHESTGGLINCISLENLGLDVFLAEKLPLWLDLGVPVIINISGNSVADFVELARRLNKTGIFALEANLSCPNVEVEHGLAFSIDAELTEELIKALVAASDLPIIAKLTPNVTDIKVIAKAAEAAGASAIAATNTFKAMRIDRETGKPIIIGGYSGKPIMPMSLHKVWEIAQVVQIPVIGMGGITNGEDAIEFLQAGATAVAVGTANFQSHLAIPRIVSEIRKWLEKKGYTSLGEIPRLIIPGRKQQK